MSLCRCCTKVFVDTLISHGTCADYHPSIPDFIVGVDERCFICRQAYLSLSLEKQMLLRSLVDDVILRHAVHEDASDANNQPPKIAHEEEPFTKVEIGVYKLHRVHPRTGKFLFFEKDTNIIATIRVHPKHWHSSYLGLQGSPKDAPIYSVSLVPSSGTWTRFTT